MASADFCRSIPTSLDAGSTRQIHRPPRVRGATFTLMPAAFTSMLSVQVLGFEDIGLLTQHGCLVCDLFAASVRLTLAGRLRVVQNRLILTIWSVRRASASESHSVRLPAVRLAVPLAGPAEDFHLQIIQMTTTVIRKKPVTALHAMHGAPPKKAGDGLSPASRKQILFSKFRRGL